MFTGIVSGVGRVVSVSPGRGGARLKVTPPARFGGFEPGESVSVSGVCLTAVKEGRTLLADLSAETLARTALASLRPQDTVNLERSLRWGDPLSGHFVLGHVDGVSSLLALEDHGASWTYSFSIPRGVGRYVAEKGSVALDGISLTVARRTDRRFSVAVIPETRRRTTLAARKPGDLVNLEADVFARYARGEAVGRIRREMRR